MTDGEQTSVERLAELLSERLIKSEWEILVALAQADRALGPEELVEATGYTERTVKKRVNSLTEEIVGERDITKLFRRTADGPVLDSTFAAAVRAEAGVDADVDPTADGEGDGAHAADSDADTDAAEDGDDEAGGADGAELEEAGGDDGNGADATDT
jgi:hypothetical protein